MRNPALASALLGLVAAVALLAACLPDPVPAAGRGHEESPPPRAAAQAPILSPKQEQTSRVVEPTIKPPAQPACRSITERLASIAKTAPDARIEDTIPNDLVAGYVAAFNAMHGTTIEADQVAIVVSDLWGDRAVVLFQHRGCEAGTEQITYYSGSGAEHEQ